MKFIVLALIIGATAPALARPLGDCINSNNRFKVDEMKLALSNGLLTSDETSKLYTTENCGEYNKKLGELLDLSHTRRSQPISYDQ